MLFAGMSFPMLSEGLRSCLFFGIYGNLLGIDAMSSCSHGRQLSYADIAVAAGLAGGLQATVATPIELVKIQMQTNKGQFVNSVDEVRSSRFGCNKNLWICTMDGHETNQEK